MSAAQARIRESLARRAAALDALAARVHAHPELGYEETRACAWQIALLRHWRFRVDHPFAGLPTAYRASAGRGRPVFCLMAEYDALPEIGHACGHNLICAAALGAGVALADRLRGERLPGTVVVMGTPAEESQGGKVRMTARGALRGIDAAMMAHPSFRTIADNGCAAITRYDVVFHGRAAHAAGQPEQGLNALDAVLLLFQGINAWRQQLPESSRIHGVVRDGGAAPNIIPERASATFFLRSPDDAVLDAMVARFRDIARGAALMTGTTFHLSPARDAYQSRLPNGPLNEAYREAAAAAGLDVQPTPPTGRASTDFGNVSHRIPGSHVYFGIATTKIPLHSVAFRRAAGTALARARMRRAAEALAAVGYRFFTDAAFRRAVEDDFRRASRAGANAPRASE